VVGCIDAFISPDFLNGRVDINQDVGGPFNYFSYFSVFNSFDEGICFNFLHDLFVSPRSSQFFAALMSTAKKLCTSVCSLDQMGQ
jgi:hypothetical protein